MFLGCKVLRWVKISPLSLFFVVSSAVCLWGCCVTFKEEEEGLEKDKKKLKEVKRGKKVLEGREQCGNYKVELWIRGGDNQPSDSRLQCPCPQLSAEVQALSWSGSD